ncbi:MAG: zinc ribbon domain-containing protein [Bacilli bacterium]|nr:zinc ribbon domain-containing protein [Bacilli bacterium]
MTKHCTNCGRIMDSDATFCVECGTANKGEYKISFGGEEHNFNQMAISGMILSFFMAPLGLALSIIGLVRSKKMDGAGRGPAIAGIIISSFIISFYFFSIFISFLDKIINR